MLAESKFPILTVCAWAGRVPTPHISASVAVTISVFVDRKHFKVRVPPLSVLVLRLEHRVPVYEGRSPPPTCYMTGTRCKICTLQESCQIIIVSGNFSIFFFYTKANEAGQVANCASPGACCSFPI